MSANSRLDSKVRSKVGKTVTEKRDSLLYVRIKPRNHKFLKQAAKETGTTVTEYVDALFDEARGA